MRVLLATYSDTSHLLGMAPLGWALRNAGHEVRVASQPKATDVITAAGLTAVPVGTDHMFYEFLAADPAAFSDSTDDYDPYHEFDLTEDRPAKITWDYAREGYRRAVKWWWHLINASMIADLVDFSQWWKPDLIIWEPMTFAGPIAAKASGAAHARLLWSLDFFARMRGQFLTLMHAQPTGDREDPLGRWLDGRVAKFGGKFSEDMTRGQFTIDHVPPSLRLDPVPGVRTVSMRYVPYNGRAIMPAWLRKAPTRPRVCVSLGISAAEWDGGHDIPVQEVLDSLGDLDVEVVATLAEEQQTQLHRTPDNTRVVRHVPLHTLMPTSSAIINHGGPGTVFTALTYDVPQLILPSQFDAPILARHLAARKAGLSIPVAEVTGEKVRECLLRLLNDHDLHRTASRLHEEMLRMPTPNDLVPEIERLTEEHRDVSKIS